MNKRMALHSILRLALAVCALMVAGLAAAPQSTADLSGRWNSNIGAVYEIQQSGNNFTWSAPSLNQSGTGTVSGNNVTISGPGWTVKGTITETNASGMPIKIVGENGVILFRTTTAPSGPPAQQPTPSAPTASPAAAITLSGQWNSNIGAVYEIQQSGNQFTWSAPSLNQSGTGTVSGNSVTISGPGWTVKGTITEKDASGKPTKIVGENSVVLQRAGAAKAAAAPIQPTALQQTGKPALSAPVPISSRLAQLGVANSAALVQKLQSRPSLLALSQQAKLPAARVLTTAQEAELTEVLGSQNVNAEQLRLLRVAGLQRPEDFRNWKDQPDVLQKVLAQWAQGLAMPAPSLQTVSGWLNAARGRKSALPYGQSLLYDTGRPMPRPLPMRPVAFGTDRDKALTALLQSGARTPAAGMQLVQVSTAALQAAAAGDVGIKPGQRSSFYEFAATRPGLYRVDMNLNRPGGTATLRWSIETVVTGTPMIKDSPSPIKGPAAEDAQVVKVERKAQFVMAGNKPLITGGPELQITRVGGEQFNAVFWLTDANVPGSGRLRLRLDVVSNFDVKSGMDVTGIESTHTTVPADGPIEGKAYARWVEVPVARVELGETATLELWNSQLAASSGGLGIIEIPIQTKPGDPTSQLPWELKLTIEPLPNRYQPLYNSAGQRNPNPNDGIMISSLDLQRNGAPVATEGEPKYHAGITDFVVRAPKAGLYSVLLGGTRTQLSTTGTLVGFQQWAGVTSVRLTALGPGTAKPPIVSVATLLGIEVSGQEEHDNWYSDADDDGDGEFTIESTVTWAETPAGAATKEGALAALKGGAKLKVIRRMCPGYDNAGRIYPSSTGHYVADLDWPVATWTSAELAKYDELSMSFGVVEHDSASWFQQFTVLAEVMVKAIKAVVNIYTGNYGEAVKNAIEFVQAASDTRPRFTDLDDIMGYPFFYTTRDRGFGIPEGSTKIGFIHADGSENLNDVDWLTTQEDRGSVSAFGPGKPETAKNAKAEIALTKAPAYWARSGARLLSFTLNQDISAEGGAPADVFISGGPVEIDQVYLYSTYWFKGRTFLAEQSARANERRQVELDVPPDNVTDQTIQSLGYQPSVGNYVYYAIYSQTPRIYLGGLSRTFLYDDILKKAGARPKYQPEPLADAPDTLAAFYQEGPYAIGHYIINNPGGYLSQLEFKVYVRIWE